MGAAHLVLGPDHVRIRIHFVHVALLARTSSLCGNARKAFAGLKKKRKIIS